jgi:hypothetical protein
VIVNKEKEEKIMGRYLVLWEADESKIPLDPEERKTAWLMALDGVKQFIKDGLVKEWGSFIGQPNGFEIVEGTEEDIISMTLMYMPYFRFKLIPIASIDQTEAGVKAIA